LSTYRLKALTSKRELAGNNIDKVGKVYVAVLGQIPQIIKIARLVSRSVTNGNNLLCCDFVERIDPNRGMFANIVIFLITLQYRPFFNRKNYLFPDSNVGLNFPASGKSSQGPFISEVDGMAIGMGMPIVASILEYHSRGSIGFGKCSFELLTDSLERRLLAKGEI
jgi:hypothetical protein